MFTFAPELLRSTFCRISSVLGRISLRLLARFLYNAFLHAYIAQLYVFVPILADFNSVHYASEIYVLRQRGELFTEVIPVYLPFFLRSMLMTLDFLQRHAS